MESTELSMELAIINKNLFQTNYISHVHNLLVFWHFLGMQEMATLHAPIARGVLTGVLEDSGNTQPHQSEQAYTHIIHCI